MAADDKFYDILETRDPAKREAEQLARLPEQIANAKRDAPGWGKILADVVPADITTRAALASLPVTRKSALIDLQKVDMPFGGLTAVPTARLGRIFASPGPIYDPEVLRPDYWRFARAFYAAGFRPGDIVHNTFAYHLTPAGAMAESGAHALDCPVIPAGVGQTEVQLQVIGDVKPTCFVGTPSFLRVLLDKAKEIGADASSIRKAAVGGEALPPSLRSLLADYGVDVLQLYGTADLGLIAYESEAREGLIIDEGVLVEIVRPGTGDPVPDGEVGEVVVTTFTPEYPLIRFGTGDLSAVLPGTSPCGRTNMRIKGWMGRADQTTKVKGMFVHPTQIAQVLSRHREIRKGRLVVDSDDKGDVMTLVCEVEPIDDALADRIAETLNTVTKLKGRVKLVAPDTLPNDGKVIEDVRKYE